jgi:hypothetical protein
MRQFIMNVTKLETAAGETKAKAVPVGSIVVHYPLLSEMGLPVEPSSYVTYDKDNKEVTSTAADATAFPVYASDAVQLVFDSLFAQVKATARNRLVTGTATLKDGAKINETVEDMLAESARSGEALAQRRAYFTSFKTFLGTLGKSAAYVSGMADIVSNVKNIQFQSAARKEAIKALVVQHAATLDAESVSKWERVMTQIDEAASMADALDE